MRWFVIDGATAWHDMLYTYSFETLEIYGIRVKSGVGFVKNQYELRVEPGIRVFLWQIKKKEIRTGCH